MGKFLKLVTLPPNGLPFFFTLKGKAFVFPEVEKLPSVCVEEFTDEQAAGLQAKFKFLGVASEAELATAQKAAAAEGANVHTLQPAGGKALAPETILAGAVTVGTFDKMKPQDVQEFLDSGELGLPLAVQLLEHTKATRRAPKVTEYLTAYVDELKAKAQKAGGAQ